MYAVLSHIFLHFSDYLTILCSYCTTILWAEFAFVGRMHQLYKIFCSYSDLYYKARSLGNLLLSVNYYPNFIIISNIMYLLTTYNYYIWAEFAMCRVCKCQVCMGRVCYVPSLIWGRVCYVPS